MIFLKLGGRIPDKMSEIKYEMDWIRMWAAIGAKGDPRPPYQDLKRRYAEPQRKYHTWKHIADGLEELRLVEHLAQYPDEVRIAYYFHDAIYDTRVKDSENVDKSAELAVAVMREAQLPVARIDRVEDLILITQHTDFPLGIDAAIMVDIDFSILGKPDAEFNIYERNIRLEYLHVDEEVFKTTRADILGRFLLRPQIFITPYFFEKYENQAIVNLSRSLKNLKKRTT